MNAENSNSSGESAHNGLPGDEIPPIEDAYQAEKAELPTTVEEDDPSLLASHALDAPTIDLGPSPKPDANFKAESIRLGEDAASAMALELTDSAAATTAIHPEQTGDWEHELSAHRVAVELRRIESDIRVLLEERDPKRKRKLSGTHRWNELEDDILSWRFSGRFDEDSLRRVQELVARRHYLFHRLRFLGSTRPTWNT